MNLLPPIRQTCVVLDNGNKVLVMEAVPNFEMRPYVVDACPYQRVSSTTSRMPQETYRRLLAEQVHGRACWGDQPAKGYSVSDLDREEIFRTVRFGIAAGRLSESTGGNVSDILTRFGLLKKSVLTNAGVVLFGTQFMLDYSRCQLRMARFRGEDKSEFLDQRQLEGHAFMLLEEAMLFLRRHLPVADRIVPVLFERADEPLFPLEALREALLMRSVIVTTQSWAVL